jgi:putative toxin-antitoxin system antitoxin component (TIGR02293 family)
VETLSQTHTAELDRFRRKLERGELQGHYYVTLLGLRTFDTQGLLRRIRKGLSFRAWERFRRVTALPVEALARFVQITSRTLSRRKEEGRLHADESERLVRAARVFASALALFEGDREQARRWLLAPQPGLGGTAPLDYAATELGAGEVEALIGRLEHGIPS